MLGRRQLNGWFVLLFDNDSSVREFPKSRPIVLGLKTVQFGGTDNCPF